MPHKNTQSILEALSHSCPLCEREVDQFYPSPDFPNINLSYCKKCGLGFPVQLMTDKEVREYYELNYRPTRAVSKEFIDSQEKRALEQYEFIKPHLKRNPLTVYDIGCGSGALLKKFPLASLYGSEWDTGLYDPTISYTDTVPANCDLVIMSHSLEHLFYLESKLKEIRSNLSENGTLFIEVPNVPFRSFEEVIRDQQKLGHTYHFTLDSLYKVLTRAGFNVTYIGTAGQRMRSRFKNKLIRRIVEKFLTPRVWIRVIATK